MRQFFELQSCEDLCSTPFRKEAKSIVKNPSGTIVFALLQSATLLAKNNGALPLFGGQTLSSSEIRRDEDTCLAIEGPGVMRVVKAIRQNVVVDHAVNTTH